MPDAEVALELRRINKWFGPVHANRDVSLSVDRGTIHGIIGENGAGKSALMSIVYGYYGADGGDILVDGEVRHLHATEDAIACGIGMVHQHFMLVENFTVLENVILGVEGGAILSASKARTRGQLIKLAHDYALDVDVAAVVEHLPVGIRQRVEILKALYRGAEILILDEPTGVLTPQEAAHLFTILGALRDQGKTVILITHKLREIMAITGAITVMRQGQVVANVLTKDTSPEELAKMMVGREVLLRVEKKPMRTGEVVLSVENLSLADAGDVERLRDISFQVRAGEIVGIAGVSGNGQSELLETLAGIRPFGSGRIMFKGRDVGAAAHDRAASAMRRFGLAHVPEDRQRSGLVLNFEAN